MTQVRGTGYIGDDPDERDFAYALRGASAPPASKNLWLPGMRIVDQGGESSCTGRSLTYALRAGYAAQTGKDPGQFSAYDAYFKARAVGGSSDVDTGASLRPLFKGVQLLGCALERDAPSVDYSKINQAPTWKAQVSAHKYRGLRQYHAFQGDYVEQAKDALAHGVPVVGGWAIRKSFMDYTGGIYQSDESQIQGGHALAVVGYAEDHFLIPNSWGMSWGESGFIRVAPSFLNEAMGLWAVDIEGNL